MSYNDHNKKDWDELGDDRSQLSLGLDDDEEK